MLCILHEWVWSPRHLKLLSLTYTLVLRLVKQPFFNLIKTRGSPTEKLMALSRPWLWGRNIAMTGLWMFVEKIAEGILILPILFSILNHRIGIAKTLSTMVRLR